MTLLYVLDIVGTLVFSISGAFRAVKYELDLLGVLVLSVATGVGGGCVRDLILGSTPPAAFQDETYLLVCLAGGLLVFLAAGRIARRWDCVMFADAIGLGVFAAIGAAKASACGLGTVGVIMMAGVTATGGGVIRDILVVEIPAILRTDFYATAAICGGACFVGAEYAGLPLGAQLACCVLITCGLRFLAMRFGISLPKIKSLPSSPSNLTQMHRDRKD
ncbi:MAG: trimeric intracellular cation channel family protein [Phycisphaerae bacterium]|jgi:uncharacterized membrane protein YeiH|nr:trimeric intracellular cation channel family protein [Phycisphaerae bacterium]